MKRHPWILMLAVLIAGTACASRGGGDDHGHGYGEGRSRSAQLGRAPSSW